MARRGRIALSPRPAGRGTWMDVARSTAREVNADGVPLLAGGVAYYAMLALFPALIAVVSIYGLVASPAQVTQQMSTVTRALPSEARQLIINQLTAVISIMAALWSASSGMRGIMAALTKAFDEEENRKFVKMRVTALVLTLAAMASAIVSLGLLVALPSVFRLLDMGSTGKVVVMLLRWPMLAALVVVGLSVLYRYGPNRAKPKWQWVTWGSGIGAAIWLLASLGLSAYAAISSKFDQTYGALGAVIVLMLWLFLSAFAILLGAEINADLERRMTPSPSPTPRGAEPAAAGVAAG
jgi:membrane protein